MDTEQIKARTRCCCCGIPMEESTSLNMVTLDYLPEWDYPRSGNLITGTGAKAIAVACDPCAEKSVAVEYAVEFRGDEVFYHEISDLQPCKQ